MAAHPFVIVPALTAIAVAYPQGTLIADLVLPRVPVSTESFRYLKYAKGDSFAAPDTRVGRKSAPNQLDWGSSELTDTVQDQALDAPVPNSDIVAWQRAQAAGLGLVGQVAPADRAAMLVTQALLNRREWRAASLVSNLANYDVANRQTLAGPGQWSDYANSDPLVTITDALDTMVLRPRHAWMGRRVFSKLARHPKVSAAIYKNGTTQGAVSRQALADELELEEIYVGDGWINTANPGQPAQLVRAWGNDCGFFYRDMNASPEGGITFGMTAQYGDRLGGTIEDPDVGMRGGQRIRVGESVKELLTANDLGFLFKNAVAG